MSLSSKKFTSKYSCIGALCVILLSTVLPAQANAEPAHCKYAKIATIPVTFERLQPAIEGTVNNTPTTMLIDTGAANTVLAKSLVEKLGIKLSHSDNFSVGLNGRSEQFDVRVKEISYGPVHWGATDLPVVWDTVATLSQGVIVGANFLFQRDLEILLAEKKMNLFFPTGCADAFLGYWDQNASSIPLGEMSPGDPRRIVTVEVNGQKFRALIDTGATTTVINLAAAARVGVTAKSPGVTKISMGGIGQHEVESWVATFDSFTIGDESIKNSRIAVTDLWGSLQKDVNYMSTGKWINEQPEMILGTDFLKAHRVLFAVSQNRLYFSYLGGEVFYTGAKMVPVEKPVEK